MSEARVLAQMCGRITIRSWEIQTAVRLVLYGFQNRLLKRGISDGVRVYYFPHPEAITKFSDDSRAGGPCSRAELLFPITRIHTWMKTDSFANRVPLRAAVYLAAVLEGITAEVSMIRSLQVLELSGNAAKELQQKRIAPRHLVLAIRGDEELATYCKHSIIPGGGVVPHLTIN
jgi:histone H2A